MESITKIARIKKIQEALKLLAALHLTTYLWPPQAQIQDGASFDFIIVGAGTAGCVVANRLSEDPNNNVLLIEAGGDPPLESELPGLVLLLDSTRFDWNYTAENDNVTAQCHQHKYCETTLGKMLGGTSSANYMIYGRGYPQAYDTWAAAAKDDTWKWNNVLPYFNKIEKMEDPKILNSPEKLFYGTEGIVGIAEDQNDCSKYLEAYKEKGNNIGRTNGPHSLGYSCMLFTMSNGSRQGPARSYLSPIKNRPNLQVLKNTLVIQVLFDEAKNAVGVVAKTDDDKIISLKATKEVIVSAGVFNTPKLLMLSGIGPKEHLQSKAINCVSDIPVGQNLHDYTSATIIHNMEKFDKPLPPKNPHEFPPLMSVEGYVALNKSQDYPDYQTLSYVSEAHNILAFCSIYFRYKPEICSDVFKSGVNRIQVVNQIINLNPKSRGSVLLRSSDPSDPPVINTGYFSEQEDLENLVDYVMDHYSVTHTTYFRSVEAELADPMVDKCSSFAPASRDYWRCYIMCMMSGMNHAMGTSSMGSVVDGKLRVYGVQRLRVADASVIPTSNGGNPYAQVMMIAEKIADFIQK